MNNSVQEGYSIKTYKSPIEIESIRDIWEDMQNHPNGDIDFYRTIVDVRDEILRPHIVVLYRLNKPVAMIIGRIEDVTFKCKFGYKTVYSDSVRSLTVIYGGVLGDLSYTHSVILVKELISSLRNREADILSFNLLKMDSDLYKAASNIPGLINKEYIKVPYLHWKMDVPSSIDVIFSSFKSKKRYWLKRIGRVLEKDFPGKVQIKYFREKEEVVQLCKDVEQIAKTTYQHAMEVGFIYNTENIRRMSLDAAQGWLRAYVMYIENKPCAFWIGTLYQNTLYTGFTGYDPKYKNYRLGTILLIKLVEDQCESKVKQIDFGFGDAYYKQLWGNYFWKEASVFVYASTFKGIKLHIINTVITGSSKLISKILTNSKLINKVKRRWRDRLIVKKKNGL